MTNQINQQLSIQGQLLSSELQFISLEKLSQNTTLQQIPKATAVINALELTVNEAIQGSAALQEETPLDTKPHGEKSLQEAMALMEAVLSALEGQYMKLQKDLDMSQMNIGDALTNTVETECQNKIQELQKQITKETRQTRLQKVLKAVEIIGATIISITAILGGNPEIAVAIITMTVLSTTGALNKLTDDIAKGIANHLEKDGMASKTAQKVANILASLIVTGATILVTLGIGAVGGALALSNTLTDDAIEGSDTLVTNLTKGVKNGIKSALKAGIMNGTQALVSTNAIVNIFEAAAMHSDHPKVKEALAILGEILQIVVAIVGMLVGGTSSAGENSEGILSKLSKMSSKLSSLIDKAQEIGNIIIEKLPKISSSTLRYLITAANLGTQALSAGPNIGIGVIDIKLGNIEELLSYLQANITQLSNEISLNQSSLKKLQENTIQILKSFENLIPNIVNYVAPEQAAATVLTNGI